MRIIFILLFIGFCTVANGQIPDSISRKVDAIFAEFDKPNSPGCALAILKNGEIIYKKGYGISNLEYNIAINPGSIFHVASIAKQFVAAAIIRLSLEGKLSLEDDIRKYIPEVPDFGHKITFNHLLHHTSGIRDQWALQLHSRWREGDLTTEKDIMEMLSRQKALNFIPGEELLYCNTGFTLAGVTVKRITGVSLKDYADSVFFKPLGMTNTHFNSDHSELIPGRSYAYIKDPKGKYKIFVPPLDVYGATGLYTTVEDLAKWDESLYNKQNDRKAFIDLMELPGVLNDKTIENYASGLVIGNYNGYKTLWHNGAEGGYRSNMLRFPEEHFTVIILANLLNINPIFLSYQVADVFLKDKSIQKPDFKTDSNVIKRWPGDYFDTNTQTILNINYRDGKLSIGPTALEPVSNHLFDWPGTISTLAFSGDSLNTTLVLATEGTAKRVYKKVKKINLPANALEEYTGDFYSPELDTKYTITVKDGRLQIKVPRKEEISLSPFIKDIFTGNFVMRFQRNKKGQVEGFYISAIRVRHMYFGKTTTQ